MHLPVRPVPSNFLTRKHFESSPEPTGIRAKAVCRGCASLGPVYVHGLPRHCCPLYEKKRGKNGVNNQRDPLESSFSPFITLSRVRLISLALRSRFFSSFFFLPSPSNLRSTKYLRVCVRVAWKKREREEEFLIGVVHLIR